MSSATCTAWKLRRSCHVIKALSVQPAFVYFFWSAKPYSINFGWRSKTCSVLFLFLGGSEEFLFVLTKFLSNAFWKWAELFFRYFWCEGRLKFPNSRHFLWDAIPNDAEVAHISITFQIWQTTCLSLERYLRWILLALKNNSFSVS